MKAEYVLYSIFMFTVIIRRLLYNNYAKNDIKLL